ncbi:hypothetical protein MalM25_00650 [Planctomycetes bacterium MalM25]|nr:hypothetical protein MalM25_00650 [Planctomycetes bacterium MalM25]
MADYPQYRAPAANDTALVDPAWSRQLAQLAEPPAPAAIKIGGLDLGAIQNSARAGLLSAAREYTSAYANVESSPDGPIVLSGHQPELFHPGVWFKNFALDALAKTAGGVGVHLLIDSDLCRGASVRTPTGSIASPRVEGVPYDRALAARPYEERTIQDTATFASFTDRAAQAIKPLIPEPLVRELWAFAESARERSGNLGRVLSEARHRVERGWGSNTLEAPSSLVCDAPEFRRFAAELLLRARDTAGAYNAALAEYRVAHHLRNAAQPLPDLATDDDWIETPLWVWFDNEPTRRALWARSESGVLTLSNHNGWAAEGPSDAEGVAGWLEELRAAGVKVRSRALVTTLYCRLVLADLFLHGIGGAKYDQVTDRFSARLFGAAPPPHATLTATLRLPIDHAAPSDEDRQRLVKRLRDLRYHGERRLPADAPDEIVRLAASKREWIDNRAADPAQRHAAITAANGRLFEALAGEYEQALRDLTRVDAGRRDGAILDSREHSFCLFPADELRERLQRLSQPTDA